MPSEWDHRGRYILLLILLLGGFLRLYHLGTPYISEDEAYHAVVASRWAETGSALAPSGSDYNRAMPLIALEALALRYLPFGLETSVRLPAALLGILNIWLFFQLGKRYGGVPLGLMAATVFAVSSWCISIGTMARMYELLMTGTLLVLLSFERLVESPNARNCGLLAAALCLATSAHDLAVALILLPLAGIVVYVRRPRLAILLGMAAAGQIVFVKAYPLVLEILIPRRVAASGEGSGEALLAATVFGLQQVQGQISLWPWVAGAALLIVGAVFILRRRSREELLYLLPGLALVLAFGIAGFLVIGGLALAAFFALIGVWQKPETARVHRLYALGFYIATVLFWILLAAVIAMEGGPFRLAGVLEAFEPAIRYPAIAFEVIRPLLMDPRTIVLLHAGMAGLALVLARVLWKGPLLPGHSSLAARILFLLGAVAAIGAVNSPYSSHRYVYFLFPAALLSLLEVMAAYWRVSAPPVRTALALSGLLIISLSELPRAFGQASNRTEEKQTPARVRWLPDHFGGEQRMKQSREWRRLDYRAAGEVLSTRVQKGDVLLADAAHQIQVYVPALAIDGHLSPRHRDYQFGEKHYFTGSVLLRSPQEMIRFLEPYSRGKSTRVWIVLTGYDSVWGDLLPSRLSQHKVWADGEIGIYALPAGELLDIARSAEGVITNGSWQKPG